ncbi:MAG: hypothetical protein ABIT38_05740 [Gemmatimonadaceae bacterium]
MRRILALLCSAAPFVASAIAASSARHDLRILWMSLVATLTTRVVVAATRKRRGDVVAAILGTLLATIAASVVAMVAGARAAFGVVAVAVVLATFATAGTMLWSSARASA